MKTTPKPSATKKSNGELVGPLLFEPEDCDVAVGVAELVEDSDDIMMSEMWYLIDNYLRRRLIEELCDKG